MTLTNYWFLLIWIFLGGILCSVARQEKLLVLGKYEIRWSMMPAIILMIPFAVWSGFRSNGWGDTSAYYSMFQKAPETLINISQYLSEQQKDKGFFFLMAAFKTFIGNHQVLFFLLIACVQACCLVIIYRKYSCDYWLSIFLFVASGDYMSWMHNGVRQFLVVTILFACTPLLIKKKYVSLIVIILLAATVHQTALIWLPFIFIVQGRAWNWKTLLFITAIITAVFSIEQFTDVLALAMDSTQYGYETMDMLNDSGTSLLRVLFYSVPAVASLLFFKRIQTEGDILINICANMSIATAGFYAISHFTSGIYIGRIPIFFSLYSYILYPWILRQFFNEESELLLKVFLVGVYLVFFYYQMHVAWGLL